MKKFLLLTSGLIFFTYMTSAQCAGGRYRDIIFQGYDVETDIVYGSNINMDGADEQLKMDVYQPTGDTENARALVILCHGGYFIGGDKAEADMLPLCEDLSRMGYVVASINYRMGLPFSLNLEVPYGQALARAVQDLRAAIRWFRKDVAENGNQYNIDPEMIFTGGSSAGGFMTLHHAYLDEVEIPAWLDMTIDGLEGGLEGESGNAGYSSDVKAIFSVSGAMGNSEWVDPTDTTPACLFHGTNDDVVTIDSGMFTILGSWEVTEIDGSNYISAKLEEYGIEYCYEINEDEGHVAYMGNDAIYDTTLSIISNFLSHYTCDIDLDCTYREVNVGAREIATDSFQLYPNPTDDKCYIRGNFNGPLMVTISDTSGRQLSAQAVRNNSELDVAGLAPGLYMVGIQHAGEYHTSTLLVK